MDKVYTFTLKHSVEHEDTRIWAKRLKDAYRHEAILIGAMILMERWS